MTQPPTCERCGGPRPPRNRRYCSMACLAGPRRAPLADATNSHTGRRDPGPVLLTVEIVLGGVLPVLLGWWVNVATGNNQKVFPWGVVVALTALAISLILKVNKGYFIPGPRWTTILTIAAIVPLLAGARAYDDARPEPSACTKLTRSQERVQDDPRTHVAWPYVYKCPKPGNALVYEKPSFSSAIVGKMQPGDSWVLCWVKAADSSPWYYTQGDDKFQMPELHSWGFMPGGALKLDHQPDSAIPPCPSRIDKLMTKA